MQSDITEKYNAWSKENPNASDAEKNQKQQELTTKAYESLSDSDKKLVDSYINKLESNNASSKENSKESEKSSSKTSSNKAASSSAKTKTGDPCSLSLLDYLC
jgi:translation elongation factor EF-G